MFTFIDLLPGIGEKSWVLERFGGECICALAERQIDVQISTYNNTTPTLLTSLDEVDPMSLPSHDILVATLEYLPPIHRGHRNRKLETNIFSICRVISDHRPKAFILMSQLRRGIRTEELFEKIKDELDIHGYTLSYEVISPEGLIPCRRKAIYIVGLLGGTKFNFPDFPHLTEEAWDITKFLEEDADYKLFQQFLGNRRKPREPSSKPKIIHANNYKGVVVRKPGDVYIIKGTGNSPRYLTVKEYGRLNGLPELLLNGLLASTHPSKGYGLINNSFPVDVLELIIANFLDAVSAQEVGTGMISAFNPSQVNTPFDY
ncbi:DNA cytosine methyltransferase [Ectobacillus funiculus]|uniref:DNA cytosine methyltransferase n=1 Tax=Ectobacillus funiculus TaxID=137993 RepID=UPI0013EE11A5|nr:DNA cytosine methyltransferase [Ectobacillus funiculus]